MIILPAIDLLNGECVRLYQGDYSSSKKVAEDAVTTVKAFIQDGAELLHVVDLNGAREGSHKNFTIIEKLCREKIKVQTGGGIRSLDTVKKCFDSGVSRVIIGSAAVEHPDFLDQALSAFGDKIIVGVDCLNGCVKTQGWEAESKLYYTDFCEHLSKIGVKTIIFTDISKDGTLQGANLEQLKEVQQAANNSDIIASGGIKDMTDIENLLNLQLYGAIAGKSIYSKTLDLKQAIERAKCWQKG